jgi:hypothetical protein
MAARKKVARRRRNARQPASKLTKLDEAVVRDQNATEPSVVLRDVCGKRLADSL